MVHMLMRDEDQRKEERSKQLKVIQTCTCVIQDAILGNTILSHNIPPCPGSAALREGEVASVWVWNRTGSMSWNHPHPHC